MICDSQTHTSHMTFADQPLLTSVVCISTPGEPKVSFDEQMSQMIGEYKTLASGQVL